MCNLNLKLQFFEDRHNYCIKYSLCTSASWRVVGTNWCDNKARLSLVTRTIADHHVVLLVAHTLDGRILDKVVSRSLAYHRTLKKGLVVSARTTANAFRGEFPRMPSPGSPVSENRT